MSASRPSIQGRSRFPLVRGERWTLNRKGTFRVRVGGGKVSDADTGLPLAFFNAPVDGGLLAEALRCVRSHRPRFDRNELSKPALHIRVASSGRAELRLRVRTVVGVRTAPDPDRGVSVTLDPSGLSEWVAAVSALVDTAVQLWGTAPDLPSDEASVSQLAALAAHLRTS